MSRRQIACTLVAGAIALQAGDVITGGNVIRNGVTIGAASVRDVVLQNGLVKVTYEAKTPDAERGSHTLHRWDGSAYTRATSISRGDWTFFAVSITVTCDRAIVVEATSDAIEVTFQWDALDMTAYDSGGPNALGPADEPIYTAGGVQKKIASTQLGKTIRVERGREGYFAGYHTNPRVGPQDPDNLKETAAGERELGLGGDTRAYFASTGAQSLHPDHGNQAGWAAAGFNGADNRPCWSQINDFTGAPWNNPAVIALQPAGFPGFQAEGPWWMADLDQANATTYPFCRYVAMVAPFNSGCWQFGAGQYGFPVVHYCNEVADATGAPHPFQVFIGAFPYTSANLALEPTSALRASVAARCPLDFRASGQAEDDGPVGTTAASIRDAMILALRRATPGILGDRRFRDYPEDGGPFRAFAERAPISVLRMFSIRDVGQGAAPGFNDSQYKHVEREWECVVAYPLAGLGEYGARAGLSLEDVLEEDALLVEQTIGTNGFQTLEQPGACVISDEPRYVQGEKCTFLVLPLRVTYWRTL